MGATVAAVVQPSSTPPDPLSSQTGSMEDAEYRSMAAAGDTHWWYRATRQLLATMLQPWIASHDAEASQPLHVLDAGGGTAATGGWLTDHGLVTIADYEQQALTFAVDTAYARRGPAGPLPGRPEVRSITGTRADLNHLPFADNTFDGVLCVTALCHRMNPDPAAIVADFARLVRPGGFVLLMEPGGRRLWRGHDDVTHTARRFARTNLVEMLRGAGLDVQRSTGAYTFLVPPAFVIGLIERRRAARSDVARNESGLFGLFGLLARVERALIRRANLPGGLSVLALAVKPETAGG
jgi:SAM-dependent methyltransferase